MQKKTAITSTGRLRAELASAITDLRAGTLSIDEASALHKLAKNISESLYSETKIAMFRATIGVENANYGSLKLGDPADANQDDEETTPE